MSTAVDWGNLESRIDALTTQFLATPHDAAMPYEGLLNRVRTQAGASNAGGKHLRAQLALSAYDAAADSGRARRSRPVTPGSISMTPSHSTSAARQSRDAMLDVACALEIYQTSALIHDDIIDDSDLRRGAPSAHKALEIGNNERLGHGLAIMLGNLLATASAYVVETSFARLHNHEDGVRAFLGMQRAVAIGQVLDLSAESIPLSDPEQLVCASLEVFRWKTASYTAIAPLELGFLAAGFEPAVAHESALHIGEPLGLAFQLADDLIDVDSSSHISGKPVGGDIREGKHTVLLADALQRADDLQRKRLLAIYGASARSKSDIAEAIGLFQSTGAIAQSQGRINTLFRQSSRAIDTAAALGSKAREPLHAACARMVPIADA
ncbi:MAG: polyprenyl synthetase family protein [Bifidobacterium sp.]|jgi:geranylgeranyl diphosphate synthase type I|nr:polyprenyl synthetase family protein [Bifidobacterium sp.]